MKRKVIFTLIVLAVSTVGLLACSSNADDAEPITNALMETEVQQEIEEETIDKDIVEEPGQDDEEKSDQDAVGGEEESDQDAAGGKGELDQDAADNEEESEQEVEESEQQAVEDPIIQDDGRGNGAGEEITESEANYFAEAEALWAEHSAELGVNWETFREEYAYERSTGMSQEEVYNNLYEMFKW